MGRPRVPLVVGSRLGRWTIIDELPDETEMVNGREKLVRIVRARCGCGFEDTRRYHTLKHGLGELRGCQRCQAARQVLDLTNGRFGMLTARTLDRIDPKSHKAYWRCWCDCGNEAVVQADGLVTGKTASCGCLVLRNGSAHPKWRGHGEISSTQWTHTRKNAEFRNILFEVTIEEAWALFLLQGRRCALTGVPLSVEKRKGVHPTASLDRVDSSGSYTLGNVQWVHKRVNLAKRDTPQDEFIEMCLAIADHYRQPTRVAS